VLPDLPLGLIFSKRVYTLAAFSSGSDFGFADLIAAMNEWRFKLLYDGECPLCRREVRWLKRLNRGGHLAFDDISAPGFDPAPYRRSHEELLGIIHGVFPDGRIVREVAVFREAYKAVGLGWVLAPTGWPFLRWIFDRLYITFARYRIPVGRLFGRSCAPGMCGVRGKGCHRP